MLIKRFFILFILFSLPVLHAGEFFQTGSFIKAHIGILVVDLQNEQTVDAKNADQFFIPASLQKVFTSVAAIHFLGNDFRFKTDLEYEGNIDKQGTLHGNLWLCGGGDPTLSLDILDEWEKSIKSEGIKTIDGKICVDISCFESSLASPYWCFNDIGNYFGAGACGFTINKNYYTITFAAGKKEHDKATVVKIEPNIPNLIVHNEVTTGPINSGDMVNIFGMEYSPVQYYRGTVPLNEPNFQVKAAMFDPAFFCGAFINSKIAATEKVHIVKEKSLNATRKLLNRKFSPPLKAIIREMNVDSINIYAEHLLKMIGDGKSQDGIDKLEKFFNDLHTPIRIKDGGGGARNNYMTPRNFVKLLCYIYKSPEYRSVYLSLPQQNEGTLKSFPSLPEEYIMKAKSGSMDGIQNLGGYLMLPSGKKYAFVIFCNNYDGTKKEAKEEIIKFLNNLNVKKRRN
jgi:D-alanyl-D-alanine carboxypeptidase/D-alanyl-D-alanine-endopeptidase (penicillin-binding protein 4)